MQQRKLRKFYEKHLDGVYRYVFFRVGKNREVAEDLTSEIFIKIIKNFDKYDPKRSEKAWVMTISRNHLINHYRDNKITDDIDEISFKLEGIDGIVEEELNDDFRQLDDALSQLSKDERRMVEMKYLEGYKYKDVGEKMKKTSGAVRIQTYRAMQKLKAIILPKYENNKKTIRKTT